MLICFIVCLLIFLLSSFTYDSSVNTQFRLQRGKFLWKLPSFSFYLFVPLYVLCDMLGILELLYVKYVIIMYGKPSLNLLVKIGETFLDDLPACTSESLQCFNLLAEYSKIFYNLRSMNILKVFGFRDDMYCS